MAIAMTEAGDLSEQRSDHESRVVPVAVGGVPSTGKTLLELLHVAVDGTRIEGSTADVEGRRARGGWRAKAVSARQEEKSEGEAVVRDDHGRPPGDGRGWLRPARTTETRRLYGPSAQESGGRRNRRTRG